MNDECAGIDVDQFINDYIDTVPHLEGLLLLWNDPEKHWPVDEVAARLFLAPESTRALLDDLASQRLIATDSAQPGVYRYESGADRDRLLRCLDRAYRRELIRITRLIHSKPSAAVRAFARAFRIKKERE